MQNRLTDYVSNQFRKMKDQLTKTFFLALVYFKLCCKPWLTIHEEETKKENFFLNNKKYKQYKQNLSNYYYLRIHQM